MPTSSLASKTTPNGRATVVGVTDHLEDAALQQLVNSKTNQPVTFSYRATRLEGKNIGVLHIPVQDRPLFITKLFGKLSADTVFLRRGSSTAVARPDEIARMGDPRPPHKRRRSSSYNSLTRRSGASLGTHKQFTPHVLI